jgi:hypothetical protein
MSRSSKKMPYVAPELLKRIEAMNESGEKTVLKTSESTEKYKKLFLRPLDSVRTPESVL